MARRWAHAPSALAIIHGAARMDLKFAKDRYDYELQRKEQLTTALTLPVTALSILGGAVIAMTRSFSYRDSLLTVGFGSLIVLDVVALFVCLVYLGRAYHRQKYVYLPLLKELEEWEEEYRQFMSYVESTGGHAASSDQPVLERILMRRIGTPGTTMRAAGCCIGRGWRSSRSSS